MLRQANLKMIVLTIGCLYGVQAEAGNWLRNEGDWSYSANLKYATSDKFWDQQGVSVAKGCTNQSTSLHQGVEYGYSYHYTLMADIGLSSDQCQGKGNAFGFGDLTLGVRGRIFPEQNGKAWELQAIIPTGYDNGVPMRLGYGRFGVRGGVHFGDRNEIYDVDPYQPAYSKPEGGSWSYGSTLTLWEGPPANQLAGYVKWGTPLTEMWKMSASLSADLSLGHGVTEPATLVVWARQPFHDVLTAKLDFSRPLGDGWSISMGPEMNLWGRNASQTVAASVGLHKLWGN